MLGPKLVQTLLSAQHQEELQWEGMEAELKDSPGSHHIKLYKRKKHALNKISQV